jgi:hypothetical protein
MLQSMSSVVAAAAPNQLLKAETAGRSDGPAPGESPASTRQVPGKDPACARQGDTDRAKWNRSWPQPWTACPGRTGATHRACLRMAAEDGLAPYALIGLISHPGPQNLSARIEWYMRPARSSCYPRGAASWSRMGSIPSGPCAHRSHSRWPAGVALARKFRQR